MIEFSSIFRVFFLFIFNSNDASRYNMGVKTWQQMLQFQHTWNECMSVYSSLDSLKETEAPMKPSWSKNRSGHCDKPEHGSIHRILVQINRVRNDDRLQKQICVKTSNSPLPACLVKGRLYRKIYCLVYFVSVLQIRRCSTSLKLTSLRRKYWERTIEIEIYF